jgi:hypothetical protein
VATTYCARIQIWYTQIMNSNFVGNGNFFLFIFIIFFGVFGCVSTRYEEIKKPQEDRILLLSSKEKSYALDGIRFGIYPGYIQDPEKFRRVNLGIGTFQGRHLLEDELRKEMQRNHATSQAHRFSVRP